LDPITLGLIAAGAGGTATKVLGGLFDNSADLMRQQAQVKLSTLEENMRRTEGAQTQVLSSTKARMAGTGFEDDSASFKGYIQTMATQFDTQNKATHDIGLKSVDLMRQGADDADMKKWLGIGGDILGGAASILGIF
jgi:hypothetical protein